VQDLPARIAELKKEGVHSRNEMEVGPSGRQIQMKDPDNNPVELFELMNIYNRNKMKEIR
jgi:glyoxylase I family protein